jgi:hypothetical protein
LLIAAWDHAYQISGDLLWLCTWFFGSLIFYLRKPAIGVGISALFAELLFNVSNRFRRPVSMYHSQNWLEKHLKIGALAVTDFASLGLIAWATLMVANHIYPVLHVDRAHYIGGG